MNSCVSSTTRGPWLELDGMLPAVNAAAPINAFQSDDEDMIRMRDFVRNVSGGLASELEEGKGLCSTERSTWKMNIGS